MERIIKGLGVILLCITSWSGYGQGYRTISRNSDLLHHQTKNLGAPEIGGYLEHLPPGYNDNPGKQYPMIIFLHGLGERGNGNTQLYKAAKHGPPKEVERLGSLCFTVDGNEECFIVLSPQLITNNWSDGAQEAFWDHVYNGPDNYRFDPDRVYLTGLSLGGNGVWKRSYNGNNDPNRIAALAPVAGWGNNSKGCNVADREIPIWAFHGINDGTVSYSRGYSMFNAVVNCASQDSDTERIFTTIQGGHGIWSDIYLPDNSIRTPNLYQWFLTQSLDASDSPGPPPNVNPIVNVVDSVEVSIFDPPLIVTATASDPDGSIATYNWEKLNGPGVTITNADQAGVTLDNLVEGEYNFRVTVEDNRGATASDEVKVIVNRFIIEKSNDITVQSSDGGLDYLEYFPSEYSTNSNMPVIIYLHTATSEGVSPTVILNEGPMKYLNQGEVITDAEPVIVVAPQIASGNGFRKGQIQNFYNYVINHYDVDENRIYIVGADEGASDLAFRLKDSGVAPDRWAAAALVGGNGPASIGCDIGNTEVNLYIAHSNSDEKYSYTKAQSLYNAVDACNDSDMFFETLSGNHFSAIDDAFNPATSNLYSWLLSRTLGTDSTDNPPSTGISHRTSSEGMPYLEYLPEGFDPSESYPALVYLHSQSAEGTNLDLIKNEGPFYFLNNGDDLCVNGQCYLVFAPQVEVGTGFKKGELDKFSKYLTREYNLDVDRMYIVGADEGASDLTFRLNDNNGFPERWAAAALIAGNGPASIGCDIGGRNINLYSGHSNQDEIYDFAKAQNLFNAVDGCSGSEMNFEILAGNHDSSIRSAFDPATSNLYAWLLDRTLGGGGPPPPPVPGTVSEKVSRHNQPYLEYLPPGYDPAVSYPVLVYLHSEAAEGDDLDLIRNEGPFYYIDNGENLCQDGDCFIVLAPQIEAGSGFWKGKTDKFYSHILAEYNVDLRKVYLVGFDDGANNGLSRMADDTNNPNRWAAAAAVGFKMNETLTCAIAASGADFYLAHGINDEIDPFSLAQTFANSLSGCSSQEVNFNALNANHQQTWEMVFDPEASDLYSWLLGKSLPNVPTASNISTEGLNNEIENSIGDSPVQLRMIDKNYRTNQHILDIPRLGSQSAHIRVISIDGRVMIDEDINGAVDLSGLRTALYIYQITDENNNPIQRGKILRF